MTGKGEDDMECEKCPVASYCEAFKEQQRENDMSYHPQQVIRVPYYECPLLDIVNQPRKD